MVDPTLTQESLTESEQHVSGCGNWRFGTRQGMARRKDFCALSFATVRLSGPVRALKYGAHGLSMRPIYVGPSGSYRKRSPTKIRIWPWVAPLRQTRLPLDSLFGGPRQRLISVSHARHPADQDRCNREWRCKKSDQFKYRSPKFDAVRT